MLDDVNLTTKVIVARQWFRRSRAGEFDFTGRHADKFEALLESIEDDARRLDPPKPADVEKADNVVALFTARGAA